MTYRQLLLAIEKAKELETELFWARDRTQQITRPGSPATFDERDAASLHRERASAAFSTEIDFDSL